MNQCYERYNWYTGSAGQWRYGDLTEAAMVGYKTEIGALAFLCEVQDYLIATAVNDRCKPAWRERLFRRAKNHNCHLELAEIIADFHVERTIHSYFANEIDEFEFNGKAGGPEGLPF